MDKTLSENEIRRDRASKIITSGHVWSAVWYLAWPTAINTIIQSAYMVINALFVGRLPNATEALAAVGIGHAALMIQFGLLMGLTAGTAALVARFLGAGQIEDADEATGQSLVLSVLGGAVSGLPLVLAAGPIVAPFLEARVVPLAADYTAIISWFSIPAFVAVVIQAALRSAGDVRSPLYAGLIMIVVNVFLDWLLIFGFGPVPGMGVHGAAVSTAISRIAGMFIMVWFLRRSVLAGSFRSLRPRLGWARRILNIGWPAALQNLMWSTASLAFVFILAQLGSQATAAQAALTVALRIEGLAFMPGVAFGMAATPLVGQNLGAGKPDRAAHSAWVAVGQAVIIMTVIGALFVIFPRPLALLFTKEAAVIPLIVSYLIINGVSEPFLAIGMVLRGALQGAGDTRFPMAITVLSLWVLRLPLAWFFAIILGLGATGAWISMAITTVFSGVVLMVWFKMGKWREVRV